MTIFSKIAAAAVLSLVASTASATSVAFDFDLSGHGGLADSYSFSDGDLHLTVTAGSFIDGARGHAAQETDDDGNVVLGYETGSNTFDDDARVGQYSNGLGVTNSDMHCYWYRCSGVDGHFVDGGVWDDFLVLSFSEDVQLTSANFSYFGHYDDFRLFYDLNDDGILGNDDFLTYGYARDPFSDFPIVSTNLIGFVATGPNDFWKLDGVHGTYHAGPSPVPLPAAGWILLAGLGALGLMRRRAA